MTRGNRQNRGFCLLPKWRPSRRSSYRGYTRAQACAIVGISDRELIAFDKTDLLRPSMTSRAGDRIQRRYTYSDLLQLKVIMQCRCAGLSLQSARKAIDCLRSSGEDSATCNLVVEADVAVMARSGDEIIDLLRGGQGALNVVPLAGVVSELQAAIVKAGRSFPN